jgi:single-strand DNA-binding protein
MKVAEIGLGIPENYKKQNGEWANRMHFVDVVLWDQQAEFAEQRLHKGDGLLVQGSLQYESWEGKDGGKRSKVKVRAQRVQPVQLPEPAAKNGEAA